MRPTASKVCTLLLSLAVVATPAVVFGQGSVVRIDVQNAYDANPGATIDIEDKANYTAVLDAKGDMVTHVKWEYQWVG